VLGRPTTAAAALVALVLGGVFEKFPGLKVVFFEWQRGVDPVLMHRMDDDWSGRRISRRFGMLKKAPSEYIRRKLLGHLEADEADLARPIAELGEDHIPWRAIIRTSTRVSAHCRRHPRAQGPHAGRRTRSWAKMRLTCFVV